MFFVEFVPLKHFNPLPPHGGRPPVNTIETQCLKFQSTPSAWRETLSMRMIRYSDFKFQSTPSAWRETKITCFAADVMYSFQSTPSAWRETQLLHHLFFVFLYFNPLPPHGGRPRNRYDSAVYKRISIHSLRMEGDISGSTRMTSRPAFQSTPSAWRETHNLAPQPRPCQHFNPLPPHGGRQGRLFHDRGENDHFNPLPPHGGRLRPP